MGKSTMDAFWHGFLVGLKDGPRLFFAPLVGAFTGMLSETRRALKRRC